MFCSVFRIFWIFMVWKVKILLSLWLNLEKYSRFVSKLYVIEFLSIFPKFTFRMCIKNIVWHLSLACDIYYLKIKLCISFTFQKTVKSHSKTCTEWISDAYIFITNHYEWYFKTHSGPLWIMFTLHLSECWILQSQTWNLQKIFYGNYEHFKTDSCFLITLYCVYADRKIEL